MKRLLLLTLLTGLVCPLSLITAQDNVQQSVESTVAIKLGTTRPIRDVIGITATDRSKYAEMKASRPEYVRNFIGRRQVPLVKAGTLPKGPDPLYSKSLSRDGQIGVVPIVNVDGVDESQSGSGPPDPCGDVSTQHYLQTVNSTFIQVFDLLGNKVGQPFNTNTIWQEVGISACCDPILLFDQEIGRWLMTELANTDNVLVALSDTEDPLGTWTAYAFATQSFPDYPKFGIWPTAYVMTTNEGGLGSVEFYAINRQELIAGESEVSIQRFTIAGFPDPNWQTAQPVDWNGAMGAAEHTHPMVMRINDDAYGDSPIDQVEVLEIIIDWADESQSQVVRNEIPVSPFDSEFCSVPGFGFSCVPQPNGQGIDGIPYIFMNAIQYRNFGTHSSIVGSFTVDATGDDDGGVRWVELRKVEDGPWELYQEGTVGSDEGLNRFMGGISIDSKGNIGLAYSVSGENNFPSLRFTGRRANDQLGKMTVQEFEFVKGGGSLTDSRFGDYASMSVDDQDVFWYTGEYIRANGSWATRVVAFRLTRSAIDIGPRSLQAPISGPSLEMEQVTACIVNHGLNPQTSFAIGLISPTGDMVIDTVTVDSLFSDSLYCHTFSTPVDFSAFGEYEVTIFTSLLLDDNLLNDTCRFTVAKQTRWDASIPRVDGLAQALCDTFIEVAFVLRNTGADTLTSADVIWTANHGAPDTIHWTGSLAMGEEANIPLQIPGLLVAENTIQVYSDFPNGNSDQNASNDTLIFTPFVTPGGQRTILELTTDNYPHETTWQVLNSSGAIILQGGPYTMSQTTFTEEWCLDTSQCYKFVILDTFGDGMSAEGVEGDFTLTNGDGVIVATLSNPAFGNDDTTAFCLQSNCALFANIFVRHERDPDGQNGSLSVFASNGNPPFQYSINNGQSFQSSSLFTNLAPGDYSLLVKDEVGCFFQREFTILECDIQIMAEVTEATGSKVADGSVLLSTVGGNGPLEYSLNGGSSFQSNPLFEGLLPDTFNIVVRDSVDCEVTAEVIVDFSSAVKTTYVGNLIKVYPNPSNGYFHFEVEGLPAVVRLEYDVLSSHGSVVRNGIAANYSGVVKGSFSLLNKPSGEYYLRFHYRGMERMILIVKL